MTDIVYLNGDFVSKASAKISVLDRGFLFGDGIYEYIPVYQSNPFRLKEHIERLDLCLDAIRLSKPYDLTKWQSIIDEVISLNGGGNLSIYIQVTRGCDTVRNHDYDKNIKPTVLVMASELSAKVAELNPIKAALLQDIRWQNCHIKSVSLLGNILLKQQATAQGFDEAVLYRDDSVTEGTSSNVFMVKDAVIYTPPKSNHILSGITRDLLIELANKNGIRVIESKILTQQLFEADEVWVSSSSREISPITKINDKIVANGEIGPISKQMHLAFQRFKESLIE